MTHARSSPLRLSTHAKLFAASICIFVLINVAIAHPLGNFTINHFARIEINSRSMKVHYVVDMAEIPTFQEVQSIDSDVNGLPSIVDLNAYLERITPQYTDRILLTIDGERVLLKPDAKKISLPAGAGGLSTLRIELDFVAALPELSASTAHRVRFEDNNHRERVGWREIAVVSTSEITVFDSTAFGSAMTDELKAYPEDMLSAPLNERLADFSLTRGAPPSGSAALVTRDGRPQVGVRDRLAELIAVPEVTPAVALLGLLIAAALGALHALSPGHGKTVVGAYLVGSRGTARHAAFLGLTVTITHTIGVFGLGLVTLFASQYIVPERLFPILGAISGGIVLTIGLSLFTRRLRAALDRTPAHHPHRHTHHGQAHTHDDLPPGHSHHHGHTHDPQTRADNEPHSHGGSVHTHLPPGADGSQITWRSLLALGISGGLLPCPSALVVLLSAISLHRVGYGLILVVAFSLGLATTLTAVGLAFVYAGRLLKRPASSGRLVRVLPAVSAFIITCAGAAICYEALLQAGIDLSTPFAHVWRLLTDSTTRGDSASTASVLVLGLVFGLKHAVEADHLAAVSTIVSERRSILGSSLVGGLWGIGHTISLLIAGIAVILLHIEIGERMALALEFCVAIMLIALGANAVRKLTRGGTIHIHAHQHGRRAHLHPHIHDGSPEITPHTHHGLRPGMRPLFVGMLHGFAGSAALMILVLSTISSPLIGMAYIAVFGVGSIGGMLVTSALVSLPVYLTANRFTRANLTLRWMTGLFSLGFGLFMVYEIGFIRGLFN